MEPNEVIAAIKKALLEEEKRLLTLRHGEWVDPDERSDRYTVNYTDGPERAFVIKTTEDSTPESVMKDVKSSEVSFFVCNRGGVGSE